MSDEPKKEKETGEKWVMPEPVFRSSEGHTPKSAALDSQGDVPTEPGFHDKTTEEITVSDHAEDESENEKDVPAQTVRESTKTRVRHPKKKGGCAKTFTLIVGGITFSVLAIIALLIYYLMFYRPTDTAF
ncbi:MAG: hypothetical protein WBO10_03660 [Pyrinomonadaceae bacterium]